MCITHDVTRERALFCRVYLVACFLCADSELAGDCSTAASRMEEIVLFVLLRKCSFGKVPIGTRKSLLPKGIGCSSEYTV